MNICKHKIIKNETGAYLFFGTSNKKYLVSDLNIEQESRVELYNNIQLTINLYLDLVLKSEDVVKTYFININILDDKGNLQIIGNAEIHLINTTVDEYHSSFTFDELGAQNMDISEIIFDEYGDLKKEVTNNLSFSDYYYYLIIDTIHLKDNFKSKGIGYKIIDRIIHYFKQYNCLILLKSFPIGFEGKGDTKDYKIAQKKLNEFYFLNDFYLIEKYDCSIFYKEI